jgi:hypothetical protein
VAVPRTERVFLKKKSVFTQNENQDTGKESKSKDNEKIISLRDAKSVLSPPPKTKYTSYVNPRVVCHEKKQFPMWTSACSIDPNPRRRAFADLGRTCRSGRVSVH